MSHMWTNIAVLCCRCGVFGCNESRYHSAAPKDRVFQEGIMLTQGAEDLGHLRVQQLVLQ
eukprot:3970003-Pyramimonas_sp.AAC.1